MKAVLLPGHEKLLHDNEMWWIYEASVQELIIHGVLKKHSPFKNNNLAEFLNIACLVLETTTHMD